MNQNLHLLLKEGKDKQALAILKENPQLADNTIVRLALDNRCLKTISFLRELDLITLEGKAERDSHRQKEYQENLDKLDNIAEKLEAYFESSGRK